MIATEMIDKIFSPNIPNTDVTIALCITNILQNRKTKSLLFRLLSEYKIENFPLSNPFQKRFETNITPNIAKTSKPINILKSLASPNINDKIHITIETAYLKRTTFLEE